MTARRLLAVHSGALGDVLLFGQLLTALRGAGDRVALAAGGEKARLLHGLGVIDEPLDFDRLPMHELFVDDQAAPGGLGKHLGGCGRLVSCFAAGDSHAQARIITAVNADRADFLPVRPCADEGRHLVDLWAERVGLEACPPVRWSVPPVWTAAAREFLGFDAGPQGFVAAHPGGSAPDKCWPARDFAALAGRIDRPVVFVLGPVERERMSEADRRILGRAGVIAYPPSLEILAGVLGAASVFVGDDSGPAHLAAVVGTPTLALFGPTAPEQFSPRGAAVRTLRRNPLADLGVDEVVEALARL